VNRWVLAIALCCAGLAGLCAVSGGAPAAPIGRAMSAPAPAQRSARTAAEVVRSAVVPPAPGAMAAHDREPPPSVFAPEDRPAAPQGAEAAAVLVDDGACVSVPFTVWDAVTLEPLPTFRFCIRAGVDPGRGGGWAQVRARNAAHARVPAGRPTTLVVAAVGYEPLSVPLDGSATGPLRIALRPVGGVR
jgi:hypothetical protein